MEHLVARTRNRKLLFHTWHEGRHLYDLLVAAFPGAPAIAVMPNHIHILATNGGRERLSRAIRAHARWLHRIHGTSGHLFERTPAPIPVEGRSAEQRVARYIWLNPCRGRLTTDPLIWPLTNYRDALGLGIQPQRRAVRSPESVHHYVSADPSCNVEGTPFPTSASAPTVHSIAMVVAWLHRSADTDLQTRGATRKLAVQATRSLTPATLRELQATFCLGRRAIQRIPTPSPHLEIIATLAGDPRIRALPAGKLNALPSAWWCAVP